MRKIHCYVYQKHVDLHAVSALEALAQYMKFNQCRKLRRFKHWIITVDTVLSDEEFLAQLMKESFHLLNPNKEGFRLALKSQASEGHYYVNVDVASQLKLTKHPLVAVFNQRYDCQIESIEERVLWECLLESSTYDQAKHAVETILLANQDSLGILANPVYEQVHILD